jgi:hypothetical protein
MQGGPDATDGYNDVPVLKSIYFAAIPPEPRPVWLSSSITVHLLESHLRGTDYPAWYM